MSVLLELAVKVLNKRVLFI